MSFLLFHPERTLLCVFLGPPQKPPNPLPTVWKRSRAHRRKTKEWREEKKMKISYEWARNEWISFRFLCYSLFLIIHSLCIAWKLKKIYYRNSFPFLFLSWSLSLSLSTCWSMHVKFHSFCCGRLLSCRAREQICICWRNWDLHTWIFNLFLAQIQSAHATARRGELTPSNAHTPDTLSGETRSANSGRMATTAKREKNRIEIQQTSKRMRSNKKLKNFFVDVRHSSSFSVSFCIIDSHLSLTLLAVPPKQSKWLDTCWLFQFQNRNSLLLCSIWLMLARKRLQKGKQLWEQISLEIFTQLFNFPAFSWLRRGESVCPSEAMWSFFARLLVVSQCERKLPGTVLCAR